MLDIAPEKVAYSVKYGKQQLLEDSRLGFEFDSGEFGAGFQGGKGTKEENRRGLRAGSGEGPQSEELLQRDDSAPGGKEWEGENSEPNCKSIR
ncbi:glycoside hydrolase family 97 N-terminal domain-containing protein [Bacteroides uniformis]|nr:glycoside hydrolase family 97 N-terminal domain-containing protein [Bacteroides uniformis]